MADVSQQTFERMTAERSAEAALHPCRWSAGGADLCGLSPTVRRGVEIIAAARRDSAKSSAVKAKRQVDRDLRGRLSAAIRNSSSSTAPCNPTAQRSGASGTTDGPVAGFWSSSQYFGAGIRPTVASPGAAGAERHPPLPSGADHKHRPSPDRSERQSPVVDPVDINAGADRDETVPVDPGAGDGSGLGGPNQSRHFRPRTGPAAVIRAGRPRLVRARQRNLEVRAKLAISTVASGGPGNCPRRIR